MSSPPMAEYKPAMEASCSKACLSLSGTIVLETNAPEVTNLVAAGDARKAWRSGSPAALTIRKMRPWYGKRAPFGSRKEEAKGLVAIGRPTSTIKRARCEFYHVSIW